MLVDGKYKVLFQCVHGSHLYGLNTENSDIDYKGVFMPSIDELLLGTSPKQISQSTGPKDAKNEAGDVDITWYSLPEFIKLCIQGETIAIDMLHAHTYPEMVLYNSEEWNFIVKHKDKFFTKNMKAFLGYAKKQAAKYGIKGSRMAALEEVHNCVEEYNKVKKIRIATGNIYPSDFNAKLSLIWDDLPLNDYCRFVTDTLKSGEEQSFYEVLGSKYQNSMPLSQFMESIRVKWSSYGDRARQAKENQGIDWKALSHAIRAAIQLENVYKFGGFNYPFKDYTKNYIMNVKKGNKDFMDEVQPFLEGLIVCVETLASESNYPDKVDQTFWNDWLLSLYKGVMNE